jgi:hypothetical protein
MSKSLARAEFGVLRDRPASQSQYTKATTVTISRVRGSDMQTAGIQDI